MIADFSNPEQTTRMRVSMVKHAMLTRCFFKEQSTYQLPSITA
jgi:hypothetical protein